MSVELAQLRFLLVDDEPFVRTLTARVLTAMGATAVTAVGDGESAIAALAAATEPFDIFVCDLNMPGMDGVELMRHVADRDYTGAVIFLSGEDDRMLQAAVELARAHRLRILGALSKPLRPDVLQSMLGKYESGPAVQQRPYTAQDPVSVAALGAGLADGAIRLVFQPKVSLASGTVIGVEALARWQDPVRGLLGPGAFVPVAEHNGLTRELTSAVFEAAMAQSRVWLDAGIALKVAVNVPADCLGDLGFADYLIGVARARGVDLASVIIEVTESQIMSDLVTPLELLMRLRMRRIGLSIDDFGTGYSSMEQLKRLPFTELKIDRAFVAGAAEDAATRAILESSVDLARKLRLSIVAEGVEARADWDLCAAIGCDQVQGYFVARPMPAPELERFLASWVAPDR